MNYKVKYILPNFEYSSHSDKTQIFIGIPSTIEKMLNKMKPKLDTLEEFCQEFGFEVYERLY